MESFVIVPKIHWEELIDFLDKLVNQEGLSPRVAELAGIINVIEAMQPKMGDIHTVLQ